MADIYTKSKRSQVMSAVRSRGNKETELALLKLFRTERITGWRRHIKLPGTPDFAFLKVRVVVFVDGCFWHRCPKHATFPATRRGFWLNKFAANQARDRRVNRQLRRLGWHVLRIWEHDLKTPSRWLTRLLRAISQPPNQQSK